MRHTSTLVMFCLASTEFRSAMLQLLDLLAQERLFLLKILLLAVASEPCNPPDNHTGAPTIPRVAWLVAENQLCNDAQFRLSAKKPDAIILRARPWKKEMEKCSPNRIGSRGPLTLSEYTKGIAKANPQQWRGYNNAVQQKRNDPEAFNLNRVGNEEYAHELLIYAATQALILCYTGQVCNHTGLRFDFIVLEQAARMPESLSMIPMSKAPTRNPPVPTYYTTMPNQLLQEFSDNLTQHHTYFQNGCSKTNNCPEGSSSILYTLTSNYRARGSAADFVREKFYEGKTAIFNKKVTPATEGIANFIMQSCNLKSDLRTK
ncbi:hypothetical protein F53441_678 [Fusarium austroafricanum]|uniref:Uncharacterized protein n=1 Tax=Fusarium austroafricanum TaxID=2364996 RepID=A0A8H4NZU9_9HYPO|nr:hypothetical protein F53441_678 [Fusarium austroafricanum]